MTQAHDRLTGIIAGLLVLLAARPCRRSPGVADAILDSFPLGLRMAHPGDGISDEIIQFARRDKENSVPLPQVRPLAVVLVSVVRSAPAGQPQDERHRQPDYAAVPGETEAWVAGDQRVLMRALNAHAVTEELSRLCGVTGVNVDLVPGGASSVTVSSDAVLPEEAVSAALMPIPP